MKLSKVEFNNEQDRDAAALAIIAIRERTPEPVIEPRYKPSLMIWEGELSEFTVSLQRLGIEFNVEQPTDIPGAYIPDA